jgi:hypothetical protein
MKLFLLITMIALFSSCGLLFNGTKKKVFLVDSPKDLEVFIGKEKVSVEQVVISSYTSNGHTERRYYPGIHRKLEKSNKFILKLGDQSNVLTIKTKRGVRILILDVLTIPFHLGAGVLIDLISGADKVPDYKYLDVPAILSKQKPRSQKQLEKEAKR